MAEQVLVVPRDRMPGGCDFSGVKADADMPALATAVREHGRYVERPVAETDASLKQLIPYVVVRDGPRVFLMERTLAGGDPRLHGKASIGVGGHLNPVDEGDDALMAGVLREWHEELETGWAPEFRLRGLINDDSNDVGAVHLGVVFEVQASGQAVRVRETEKLVGRFVEPHALVELWPRLETWSQLVAEALLGVRPGQHPAAPA